MWPPPSVFRTSSFAFFYSFFQSQISLWSLLPPSSTFENTYNYIEPMQKTQDNLPSHLKLSTNPLLSCKVTHPPVLEIRGWIYGGGGGGRMHYSVYHAHRLLFSVFFLLFLTFHVEYQGRYTAVLIVRILKYFNIDCWVALMVTLPITLSPRHFRLPPWVPDLPWGPHTPDPTV